MNRKHTITQPDWWNYPVLQEGENTPFSYEGQKQLLAQVYTGTQDGIAVLGVHWNIPGESEGCGGGGCNPGRKWGEFPALRNAELFGLNYLLQKFQEAAEKSKTTAKKVAPAITAIQNRIRELTTPKQLQFPF